MEITNHHEGDYLIPDLVPPESPHIGIWGERRRQFLRRHRKPLYSGMLMSGTLNVHLEEIDREAGQLEWVRRMNAIRLTAEEIVRKEWIET